VEGSVSEMILHVAISMWVDYVHSASPPVAWHEKDNYHHWLTTATERDRRAWLRSARVAIEAMREPAREMVKDEVDAHQGSYGDAEAEAVWKRMIDRALE
jgi:hypothetical protein